MRKVLKVLIVLAALSAAGAVIFYAARTADRERDSNASRRTSDTTTSTSALGAGTASTRTTSSAPSTTTTSSSPSTTTTGSATGATVPGATTTVTGPTTTTSPGGSVPDCGRGVARAVAGVTKVENAYEVTATVRNEADRAIEIDTLVVRVTYPGPRTANYPGDATKFAGTRIEPGQEVKFAIRESRATEAPTSFEVAEFSYHTVDLPQCKSS